MHKGIRNYINIYKYHTDKKKGGMRERNKGKRLEGKLDNVIKFGKCMLVQNVKKKYIYIF